MTCAIYEVFLSGYAISGLELELFWAFGAFVRSSIGKTFIFLIRCSIGNVFFDFLLLSGLVLEYPD